MHNLDADKEILFISPVFKEAIWGGDRLRREWGYKIPFEHTGECWTVSAHPHGEGAVTGGRFDGVRLSRLWKEQPQLFGNMGGEIFPLLVKIIAAETDLSIQVHPGDEYAKNNEDGALGKTEGWYILDAPEGASLVVGHNARDKAEFEDMVRRGEWKELLREVPVKKGDFIWIHPGTVHAIRGGIEIFETQTNSDITYRVYDYDRLQDDGKPRKLHVRQSMDVITAPSRPLEECAARVAYGGTNSMNLLGECDSFRVWKIDVDGEAEVSQDYPFLIMSVIEGEGVICGQPIKKGSNFILPHGFGMARLRGRMEIIVSTVKKKYR